uniref:G-protein coupled receptors family 1 profile domain-containing protein n=1 Tax=Panagrolaimus sp. PS1159 TaxID=55785 RepID=A0AC35EZK2_9BILA
MQGISIVGNSFIIVVFLSNFKLRNNKSLYLVPVLCMTNSLFSLSALPFTVYQFVMISKNTLLFNPFLLAMASTPTMIDFKLNLIITIMVAIDRVQVMQICLIILIETM